MAEKREPQLNNVEPQNESQEPIETLPAKTEIEKDSEIERAKSSFAEVFDSYETNQERVDAIIKRLEGIFKSDIFDEEMVKKSLQSCVKVESKEAFVSSVIFAIEPILAFRKNNRQQFEKIARDIAMERAEQEGMTRLNEVMYYGKDGNFLHIHLAHARDLGIGKLRGLVINGLQKLADVVSNNEEIKEITATSWIIAKNPKLIEKLGFEVKGEISEELRSRHFSDDKRSINAAAIKREEFLKKYLKK